MSAQRLSKAANYLFSDGIPVLVVVNFDGDLRREAIVEHVPVENVDHVGTVGFYGLLQEPVFVGPKTASYIGFITCVGMGHVGDIESWAGAHVSKDACENSGNERQVPVLTSDYSNRNDRSQSIGSGLPHPTNDDGAEGDGENRHQNQHSCKDCLNGASVLVEPVERVLSHAAHFTGRPAA